MNIPGINDIIRSMEQYDTLAAGICQSLSHIEELLESIDKNLAGITSTNTNKKRDIMT